MVRCPGFEVFGTSNPELRTSGRTFLACLARPALRFMDAGGLFQHPARAVPELLRKAAPYAPLVTGGLATSHSLRDRLHHDVIFHGFSGPDDMEVIILREHSQFLFATLLHAHKPEIVELC